MFISLSDADLVCGRDWDASAAHQRVDTDVSVKCSTGYHSRVTWAPLNVKTPLIGRR